MCSAVHCLYYPFPAGERLIKKVYEAIRAGPKWEETLFIITYDEHGGFYDHVAPPAGEQPPVTLCTLAISQSSYVFVCALLTQ